MPHGLVDVAVPIDATSALLTCPDVPFKQRVLLGRLDPADTVAGAQARLQNLGAVELCFTPDEAIAETGASSPKEMGAVMKVVMGKVKGRADGAAVSAMVRARLGA